VRAMISARGDRVVACCSARFRLLEPAMAAAKLIASGALGELRVLHTRFLFPADERPTTPAPAWRLKKSLNGGGILMNLGCYSLDYLLGLAGWKLKPKTVLAQCWPISPLYTTHVAPGSDAEVHAVAMIRCENGAVITLEGAESTALQADEACRIVGSHGSLRMRITPGDEEETVYFDQGDERSGVTTRVAWQGKLDFWLRHANVVRDFADAIREGRAPATSLERAMVVQQVCDAIYESAKTGAAVSI
jgi:predicted dehydrogenase